MADTHVWTSSLKPSGPAFPSDAPVTITGNVSVEFDDTVQAGTTAQLDCGSIDRTKIVSFGMHSDQVAVTVNTNAADATGGQTFALGAAKSDGWNNTMSFSNPVTNNITALFVINPGAKDTKFRASFLLSV